MKIALVTGGSRGIGKAICLNLAAEGYHVLINYVANDTAANLCLEEITKNGGSAELLKFDVSDNEACRQSLEVWQNNNPDKFIEVLVNNAGIRIDKLLMRMDYTDWTKVISTNLTSFYNITQVLVKKMIANRKGRIINMASVSGQSGLAGQTNYSAAKAGIIGATKALATELASRGITVNAIAPGLILTDMVEGLDLEAIKKEIPAKRFGQPEEIAHLVNFLASDKSGYITGQVIGINGGLYK